MIRSQWRALLSLALVATAPIAAGAQQLVAQSQTGRTKIEIQDLKREDGGLLMLRFKVTNVSGSKFHISISIGDVHLIDAANRKKYLIVRDSKHQCVCSLSSTELEDGGSLNLWAKFPAPPETVRKVSVVVPAFEPIDVPITSR